MVITINWEMMTAIGTISMSVIGAFGIWAKACEARKTRITLEKAALAAALVTAREARAHHHQLERHHREHEHHVALGDLHNPHHNRR